MLYLIGLGLSWRDLSLKALEAIQKSDIVYLEGYTSLSDFSVTQLERLLGKKIEVLDRKGVEEDRPFFEQGIKDIALLVYGDPLSATTHTKLIEDADKKRIKVKVFHAPSVLTAVAATGLQLYKFGKTASIPIPERGFEPESFFDILKDNQLIKAHTLFLLDLKPEKDEFLSIPDAIKMLIKISKEQNTNLFTENTFCIACARLGTDKQNIIAGLAKDLMKIDFGNPPYCLIVPSKLHFSEEDFIKRFL